MRNLDVLISRTPGFGRVLTVPYPVADGKEKGNVDNNEEDKEEQEEEESEEEEDEEDEEGKVEEEEENEDDEENDEDFIQSLNGKKHTCPIY